MTARPKGSCPPRPRPCFLLLALASVLASRPAPARPAGDDGGVAPASVVERLGLSGFVEARAADRRSDPSVVSFGGLEVDLAKELGRDVQVGAAVVLGRGGAAVTVAFVDVHLFGGLVAPRGRLPVERGFHVQAGRFDVPFGNDWKVFAAKDRTEASAPLTTDDLMDGGANDVGLRVLGATGTLGYSVFLLRGAGTGAALGGRVGFTPFDAPFRLRSEPSPFEAGVSLLHDVDASGATERVSIALDSEARTGPFRLRAEWLRTDARPTARRAERAVRSGWHVTASCETAAGGVPLVPFARYEAVTADPPDGGDGRDAAGRRGRVERLTAGLNATLFRRLTLKAEVRRILAAPLALLAEESIGRSSWLVQAVVAF